MMPSIASVDHSADLQADAAIFDACASESVEHGNSGNMAQPSSTHSSRLEALPNELKVAIFEQLVCDKNHWTSRAKPDSRDNLRNLCLVSKGIDLIARPLLYKKISIVDFRSLVKLYRTISEDQHLGGEIKEIDLPVHCQQESDISLQMSIWIAPAFESPTEVERKKLFDECYQLLGEDRSDLSDDTVIEWDLAGIMCFNVLARTVNLSTLKMTFMRIRETMLYPRSSWEHATRTRHPDYSALFDRVRNATRSTAVGAATQFLSRLETLTLRSMGLKGGRAHLDVEMFQCFLDLPSLRTVRSISDDGNWNIFAPSVELYEPLQHLPGESRQRKTFDPCLRAVAFFHFILATDQGQRQHCHTEAYLLTRTDVRSPRRNITTLQLYDSSACQDDMEDIAEVFPCLEVLSVKRARPGSTAGRAGHYIERSSLTDLSTILGNMTALRSLEIEIYPDADITSELYHNVITASLGPSDVLSLARLPNLQRLEVPLYMFAHMSSPALGGTIAVPREVLPQSLKHLVLLTRNDCGWPDFHIGEPCWDSVATALGFLESLGDDLPCLPNLESVAYRSIDYSCGYPLVSAVPGGQDNEAPEDSTTSRLQAVCSTFSKQNVQFLLQEADPTDPRPNEL